MTTTPETPEQIIAQALVAIEGGDRPLMEDHREDARTIAHDLRAAGLLVDAPTEMSRLAAEAWAIRNEFVAFWGKHSSSDLARVGYSPRMPETPVLDRWHPRDGGDGLAAAGVAPQEPSECSDDGCLHYDHSPAPSSDREKCRARRDDEHGQGMRCILPTTHEGRPHVFTADAPRYALPEKIRGALNYWAENADNPAVRADCAEARNALAAPPSIDEAKLAEIVRDSDHLSPAKRYRHSGDIARDLIARREEWLNATKEER